jgi:hypothetical protein
VNSILSSGKSFDEIFGRAAAVQGKAQSEGAINDLRTTLLERMTAEKIDMTLGVELCILLGGPVSGVRERVLLWLFSTGETSDESLGWVGRNCCLERM